MYRFLTKVESNVDLRSVSRANYAEAKLFVCAKEGESSGDTSGNKGAGKGENLGDCEQDLILQDPSDQKVGVRG